MATYTATMTAEEFSEMTPDQIRDIHESVVDMFTPLKMSEDFFPIAQYRGFWAPIAFPLCWPQIKNFPIPQNEIIIASFPKSGTHWVKQMAYLVETLNFDKPLAKEYRMCFDLPTPAIPVKYDLLESMPAPRYIFTHMAPSILPESVFNGRLIYVYRNPKDVCVSYFHHWQGVQAKNYNFTDTFEQFARRFMSGRVLFGPYPDHLKGYFKYKRQGKNILLLCYEDMKKDHKGAIRKIASFLGRHLDDETVDQIAEATSFSSMKSNLDINWSKQKGQTIWKKDMDFFRKGETGDWKNYFTDEELLTEFNKFISDNLPKELADS